MDEYNKNLELIEWLKTFKGGDNEDVPLHTESLNDMKTLVQLCKDHNIPQPEIFPWAGGNGVQAEWSYDWYLEVDSCDKGVSILCVNERYYDDAINIKVNNILDAFKVVKAFIKHVVDLEGER